MSGATRFAVTSGRLSYLGVLDDAPPVGARTGAIVSGRLVDELTGQPVAGAITVQPAGTAFARPAARAAVLPQAVDGGIVGLVGTPMQVLPALAATNYDIGLAAQVPGYIPVVQTATFGPVPAFPDSFLPVVLGDIAMHRAPVTLLGRANARTPSDFKALPNATVSITAIWRTVPTLTVATPASPANLAAVAPPMYAPRASGASVDVVALTPNAAAKTLLRPATAGATQVWLSDRVALAAGDLLGIDELDPERAEWVVVKAVTGASTADQPAVATLAFALARSHAVNAVAHPNAVGAPIATQTLSLAAAVGDTTLMLSGMAGIVAAAVRISDAAPFAEFHRLAPYEALTDGDGQWRLPPLSRVAQVTLTATHPSFTTPPRTVTVEYPRDEQRLDLAFV